MKKKPEQVIIGLIEHEDGGIHPHRKEPKRFNLRPSVVFKNSIETLKKCCLSKWIKDLLNCYETQTRTFSPV